jgi:hypothetical protein
MVAASLRALLTGVVDYAGLFPPAKLPLDQSIRNYARYRTEPESWMLGRFICPAERLSDLSAFVPELFQDCPPLAVSALGRGGKDASEFRDGLRKDANDIEEFRRRHGGRVTVDVVETRLPPSIAREELTDVLTAAHRLFSSDEASGMMPYYEASSGEDWSSVLITLGRARKTLRQSGAAAGFKLRCGGIEASAFPTPTQVTLAVVSARAADVPLKFTAGLHHPIRRHDAGIGTIMHGFLNVFVAGVLANARGIGGDEVREIIEDESAESFAFSDEGLRWRFHAANLTEIEFVRRSALTSFGSCSFDEPREDLRALKLLTAG